MNRHPSHPSRVAKPRWWLLAIVAFLTATAFGVIWLRPALHRQYQVMQTLALLAISLLLVLVWLLFLSRLRWQVRLGWLGTLVLVSSVAAASFRLKGMSGDFVPIIDWRWNKQERSTEDATGTSVVRSTGADYPQFLGPERNGHLPGLRLQRDWVRFPPKELWRRTVGSGWSAFAVSGGQAITQEQYGGEERVVSYDLTSGRQLWSHADSTRYSSAIAGTGPRATPTIEGSQVFTVGATGLLNCLDLASGRRLWSTNMVNENGGQPAMWGVACSPLICDSLVVVSAGGGGGRSLVAYHRNTGRRLWSGGDDPSGYSSPALFTLAGRRQIVIFNRGSVVSHDPSGGAVLWRQAWPRGTECVTQPLPLPGNRVLVSSGYGIGAKLYQVATTADGHLGSALLWESPRLKAKFANLVHRDGFVYGLDDGVLVCLDPQDGQRRWKGGRYGHGQIIMTADLILVVTESGELVLVEARPDQHAEVARLETLEGKTWNPPALAAPYLLLRHDHQAVCYEMPLLGYGS